MNGTGRKTLSDYREQVWGCVRCNYCQSIPAWNLKSSRFYHICPAFFDKGFAAYSGMGKVHIARAILEGDFDYDESPQLMDIIYRCTACGGCQMNCLPVIAREPLKVIEALRAKVLEDGQEPFPEHQTILRSMKDYGNPYLQPRGRKERWTKGLEVSTLNPDKKGDREILYYVGCTSAYDPKVQQMTKDTAEIFNRAGIDYGILGNREICCGSTAMRIGAASLFEEVARKNIALFNSLGVEKIVTSCAGCYRVLKWEYSEVGKIKPQVLHFVEYLDCLIKDKLVELRTPINQRVTWHDPCHLGRLGGIYEEPRRILNSLPGIELFEMERIKDYAWCCGAGGGARAAFPDFARRTAEERLEEARATGADMVVTQCPFCLSNLSAASEATGGEMAIVDIAALVRSTIV